MNGFLEWLPEFMTEDDRRPVDIQAEAVQRAATWIKPGGCMVIGLENRYGAKYLLGGMDDHTNLRFTSVLPRSLGGWLYQRKHKKPFRCHTPSLFDLHRWAAGAGVTMETVLTPLPTYREPHACIKADDVDGMLEVAKINAKWIQGAPFRHRALARAAFIGSPLIRLFPGLGRFLTNYFLVVLRKPGVSRNDAKTMVWNGSNAARLVRNQHVGTWTHDDLISRISLACDDAALEGEVQLKVHRLLPEELKSTINPPLEVLRDGSTFGSSTYRRMSGYDCASLAVRDRESQLLKVLKALAQIPVETNAKWCGPIRAFYALGEEGASHLVDELTAAARPHLPLDRLTHGDLIEGNLLTARSKVVLVDWEAAGAGHPWLDWLRFKVAQLLRPSTTDLGTLVSAIRQVESSDKWTTELFPGGVPFAVRVLATGYILVAEDFSGLMSARKAGGTTTIERILVLCATEEPRRMAAR